MMTRFNARLILHRSPLIGLIGLTLIVAGCSNSYEETVAGVKVPIPNAMTKSQAKGMQLSLAGFGGAQASFQGNLQPEKIVEFYKKEMPNRGWQPNIELTSKGGMLTYTKENQTVVVMATKSDGGSSLSITVGGTGR
ncbi:MAG: hypothetical protein Q8S00_17400 [Deltaproteobacteria bacterium]|nr:hypothetical protein [Deltaproteobacteria bacterium]